MNKGGDRGFEELKNSMSIGSISFWQQDQNYWTQAQTQSQASSASTSLITAIGSLSTNEAKGLASIATQEAITRTNNQLVAALKSAVAASQGTSTSSTTSSAAPPTPQAATGTGTVPLTTGTSLLTLGIPPSGTITVSDGTNTTTYTSTGTDTVGDLIAAINTSGPKNAQANAYLNSSGHLVITAQNNTDTISVGGLSHRCWLRRQQRQLPADGSQFIGVDRVERGRHADAERHEQFAPSATNVQLGLRDSDLRYRRDLARRHRLQRHLQQHSGQLARLTRAAARIFAKRNRHEQLGGAVLRYVPPRNPAAIPRLISISAVICAGSGLVIRRTVSLSTRMPKCAMFSRTCFGSLLPSRVTASMKTVQSRRLYKSASSRPRGFLPVQDSWIACNFVAAFNSSAASSSRGLAASPLDFAAVFAAGRICGRSFS